MNNKIRFVFFILFISCFRFAVAQTSTHVVREKDGVTVYPDSRFSGNTEAVRLQVISDKIIRVTAFPTLHRPDTKSLVTVYQPVKTDWTLVTGAERVSVKTASLTAVVNIATGAVSFNDKNGKQILTERQYNGRLFKPTTFEGEKSYGISQTFEPTGYDALYGLGQHQDDQFNYRNQQVLLFQNNTEVAVPFLLSSKNYGILWDNYSLTTVGDPREYMPLSSLKLYAQDGRQQGWLTAFYSNDRSKPADVVTIKAESEINYPYLGDTKKGLPAAFKPQNGVVTWEGYISSEFEGTHQFRFSYAGYLKVWIDGKLLLDRWRQAWNPGTGIIKPILYPGGKYRIKIEWIPDGGESYLSAKWISPPDKATRSSYGFSSEAGKQLDYYFISGHSMDDVISGYRTLTGKATIVPKWAMGFWQSRERYKTQDELLGAVQEFRKRKIPLDNIVLDWSYWKQNDWGSQEFDSARFRNPDSMIRAVHDHKAQFMISVWPKFYEGIPAYKQFDKNGWLYKRNVADSQRDWIAQGYVSTFYDVFNKDARKGFWDLLNNKLYKKGIDAWWMDASEPDILSNVNPEKRKAQMTPTAAGLAAEYLNAYPLENARGIYEGQRSVDPDKRVFLLTRSGFAGSQRYGATIWSGDIATRWEDMKAQISAGLNFSMSGLPFWTMDIGGFSVERRYERPKPDDLEEWRELQTRWYQFGSFVPLFRAHGQFPFREIYNIAPETHTAYQSMLFYNKLRYRLMPYLYTLAGMTYHNDYTIMRGLVMDFGNDPKVTNIGDQFMLGPSLLVNPVYEYKARTRSVHLPAGQGWYNLYSGQYQEGGKRITVDAGYDTIPVFVKEGSILPSGPELQYVAEKPTDTVTLHVYTGKDASFVLYEDENLNYNYEKGKFSNIPITYTESTRQLTIGERKGSFEGMLQNRVFRITWISRAKPEPLAFNGKADAVINYSGKATIVSYR